MSICASIFPSLLADVWRTRTESRVTATESRVDALEAKVKELEEKAAAAPQVVHIQRRSRAPT